MKILLADTLFLNHTKSAFIGGDNIGLGPTHFEWEPGDPDNARFVTDSCIKDAKGHGQVAWLLEPFFMHPENYFAAMGKPFDAVLTHNEYFATHYSHRNWLYYPHGGSWISKDDWGIHHAKLFTVSILLSEKDAMTGHKLRHEIVTRYGSQLDAVFGLTGRVRPVEAYGPFRYSIIVENERAPGYFTEKLIDCMCVGTIPIYWGDPFIGEKFRDGGIRQFNGIGDLAFELDAIGEEDYLKRKKGMMINWSLAQNYAICEDQIYERYPHLFGGGDG